MSGRVHHVDITVSDLARSTEFYARILPLMGFRRLPDCADGPGLHHLAFAAPYPEAVDHLHRELLRLEVTILDSPARYDHYAPGYYAVFFADPDRVKLEYVFTPQWPV